MDPTRVILVEDERIVALHLRQQLAKMGYIVAAVAASGEVALREIEAQRPDVVLMDIHLEGPIDGIETTSRIAPDLQIPIIYLTAYAEEATLERARETKPYGYLLKPFSERELHATIQMALARRSADILLRNNEQRLEHLVRARTEELENQISQRQKAEQALHQAQKLEAVGRLTSGIAHEFNNLLTVVIGGLTLLERRIQDPSNANLVSAALEAAARGASLVRQLLSFGRRQMVQPENLDINILLLECERLVRNAVGPLIQVDYQLQQQPTVSCLDREEFERAILNLAVNARQAMQHGGIFTIETTTETVTQTEANDDLNVGHYIRIVVRDTGHGMAPDILARAFEPFFTSRDVGDGSGLGLSQVYGFTKQSRGHATIESSLGKGTSVMLYLPLAVAREDVAESGLNPIGASPESPPERPRALGRIACESSLDGVVKLSDAS